jgi:rfaE bifunctional protein kinase chain/domain
MLIEKLNNLKLTNKQCRILVIGDLMIDHYIVGTCTRLSPEAPVPVVNVQNETTTLGGAGNVVQNLVSLGADVIIAGVVGNDDAGKQILQILDVDAINTDCIIKDNLRLTTVKTRVLAGGHQLVRFDKEHTHALTLNAENDLVEIFTRCMFTADMIVFSDYNKGLFSSALTQRLITAAKKTDKPVIVDPKGNDYRKYKGAYIIKPNRQELAVAANVGNINSMDGLKAAAKVVFRQTGAKYLIVTLSEEGMVILTENDHISLPVKATEVFDVTGAGDTVLATITYFLALGLSLQEACELANHAAAIVIRQIGAATTTVEEIISDIKEDDKRKLQVTN